MVKSTDAESAIRQVEAGTDPINILMEDLLG